MQQIHLTRSYNTGGNDLYSYPCDIVTGWKWIEHDKICIDLQMTSLNANREAEPTVTSHF